MAFETNQNTNKSEALKKEVDGTRRSRNVLFGVGGVLALGALATFTAGGIIIGSLIAGAFGYVGNQKRKKANEIEQKVEDFEKKDKDNQFDSNEVKVQEEQKLDVAKKETKPGLYLGGALLFAAALAITLFSGFTGGFGLTLIVAAVSQALISAALGGVAYNKNEKLKAMDEAVIKDNELIAKSNERQIERPAPPLEVNSFKSNDLENIRRSGQQINSSAKSDDGHDYGYNSSYNSEKSAETETSKAR